MSDSPKPIRIFISSPGDVAEERDGAKRVVEGLQRLYRKTTLQCVLWEELALPATASFQETIDILLEREPIDIAVFILWSRLGSPLGASIKRADGTMYRSGTEREFDLMLTAFEQSGRKRPIILAYVRNDDKAFNQRLANSHKTDRSDLIDQHQLAEAFVVEHFHDAEGRNIRAYQSYQEPIGFLQRLRIHLRRALDDLLDVDSVTWTEEPYRGLETFDVEHAPIFYGREEETCDLLQRLRDQQESGCGFVVVVGGSGSGKSSLARAGVAANLVQHTDDGGGQWQVAAFIPSLANQSLAHTLVRSLGEVLPELIESDATVDRIAKGFADNPKLTVDLTVVPAFARAKPTARLLLILDQMEELWTDRQTTEQDRENFLAAIKALAESGHVAVLATLRSDFYSHAQSSITFLSLKGERGHVDLLAPDAASIHRLITEPARLAGLKFEQNEQSGRSLDEVILQDATNAPNALPLLEYTLSELYRQRDQERGLLTEIAYHELGGVEGAIGKRAEETFIGLSAEAQAALNEILPLLISIDVAGEQAVVRRRAYVSDLTATSARKALTDQLVAARFLTTDREGETPIASLAHEALLRSWDRIAGWINANRLQLRLRARVEQLQQRWEQQDRDESLLLAGGLPLNEGRQLLNEAPHLLNDSTKDYIRDSIVDHDHKAKQTRRRRTTVLSTIAALLIVMMIGTFAGTAALLAIKTEANRQLVEANTELELSNARVFGANEQLTVANQQAKERFELARQAIKLFHGEVGDDLVLKADQFQPLRNKLLKGAADFYANLETLLKDETDRESREAMADAYSELGFLTEEISDIPAALEVYQKELDVRRQLADSSLNQSDAANQSDPNVQPDPIAQLAGTLITNGRLQNATGKSTEAIASYQEVFELIKDLPESAFELTEQRAKLAEAHAAIGMVFAATGKMPDAEVTFRTSVEMLAPLVEAYPNDQSSRNVLANSQHFLGILLLQTGRVEEAMESLQSGLRNREHLAAESDKYREAPTGSYNSIGILHAQTGQPEAALTSFKRTLEINRSLSKDNPAVTKFRSRIADTLNNIGLLYDGIGKADESLDSFRESVKIRQQIVDQNPAVPDFQNRLATATHSFGNQLWSHSRLGEAFVELQRARDIRKQLVDENPTVIDYASSLAGSYNDIGLFLDRSGKPMEAIQAYNKSLQINQKLSKENPQLTKYRDRLSNTHLGIAFIQSSTGRRDQAMQSLQEGLKIQQALADANPSVQDHEFKMANLRVCISAELKQAGKREDALAESERARTIFRSLLDANPTTTEYKHQLGGCLVDIGELLYRLDRKQEAEASYHNGIEMLRQLIVDNPAVYMHSKTLAGAEYQFALFLTGQEANADAVATLQSAIERFNGLPSRTRNDLFTLGCCHSCLVLLSQREGSDLKESDVQEAADRAVETLRFAIDAGFADSNPFIKDDVLAPIRDRPDFQDLIKRLTSIPDSPSPETTVAP